MINILMKTQLGYHIYFSYIEFAKAYYIVWWSRCLSHFYGIEFWL